MLSFCRMLIGSLLYYLVTGGSDKFCPIPERANCSTACSTEGRWHNSAEAGTAEELGDLSLAREGCSWQTRV